MAKATVGTFTEKNKNFARLIMGNAKRYEKDGRKVSIAGGKCATMYYNRLKKPEAMTVQELRAYIKELQIEEEDVLNFLYQRRTSSE